MLTCSKSNCGGSKDGGGVSLVKVSVGCKEV